MEYTLIIAVILALAGGAVIGWAARGNKKK